MAQLQNQWIATLPGAKPEDESGKKAAFAIELLKTPADPFRAALAVFATNTNKALRVANEWPADPFVIAEVRRLKDEEGELSFLPSKADLARSLWDRAHSDRTCNDDFTKMARLYAEIMDFVPKVSKLEANVKNSSVVQVIASATDAAL